MKRFSVVLILLLVASSLFAQVYRSNQLYQRLEAIPSVADKGYSLEVTGNNSILYLDGKAVVSINETTQGSDRIIEQVDLDNGDKTVLIYQNGLLARETRTGVSGLDETIYTYINGHLAFCSIRHDGETLENIFFLRSSNGDEPVAVKDNSGLRFMSGSYMFQSGELYQILSSNLVLTGDYEVLESGEILVKLEDGTYTYSSDGLLMRVEQGTSVTKNEYEGNRLVRSEKTDGKNKTITSYENGMESEVLDYENGQLVSRTTFPDTGKVQVVYSNGRELATVYYKMDNKTVDRIEYK